MEQSTIGDPGDRNRTHR